MSTVADQTGRVVQNAGVMDMAATSTVILSFLDVHMQGIALSLGALWYAIQIWESPPGDRLRRRVRKLFRRDGF